ncbi:MAG: glycerate kinase [Actinomycetota bacterium]|nr:glycerate kinase [Actinomycetota bacterium]
MATRRRVLAAPDKFRGTATAAEVAAAVQQAAGAAGWTCDPAPVADGGEGTLEALLPAHGAARALFPAQGATRALAGTVHRRTVRGPLGDPVTAQWRMQGDVAVVEMAQASGLGLVGGARGNDPLRASTAGTGELIAAAIDAGACQVIVGAGGSASTDGGLAALTALNPGRRLRGVDLIVACDVTTTFVDAADVFAAQKGASPAQVALLRRRLERLAQVYVRDYGVDVRHIPGSGAAGGLAGGLAAAGATLVPGFDVVADAVGLADRAPAADLVVTGEGVLDAESFAGKAVGGVVALAVAAGVPVLVVAGEVYAEELQDAGPTVEIVSLTERFGPERARTDVLECVRQVVGRRLEDVL